MESDDELFLTQNRYNITLGDFEINDEFETLINLDKSNIDEITLKEYENENSVLGENQNSSDTELFLASQEIENKLLSHPIDSIPHAQEPYKGNGPPETFRFGTPLSGSQLETLSKSAFSTKTENKSLWAVRLFNSWCEERQKRFPNSEQHDLLTLARNEADLNRTLMTFITEVRKQNGTEYRGNSLYEILSSLQYYVRRNGIPLNFFTEHCYEGLRNILDAKMKALVRQGIGITKRQAKVITEEEEDILWARSLLGSDSPQQLSDTLVYLIGLNFALRAGDEHRFLRAGETSQLKVVQNVNEGSKYLVYTEDMSKTNRGGLKHRKCERKVVKVSQNNERPERCLVRLYEMYLNLRPRNGTCQAFYLRPVRYPKTDVWFADIPIGVHTLTQTVGRLCKAAGFSGFYTNHSLRATTATRLYDAGLDEQLICERTGHKSSAIRCYKRTSEQLTAKVDSIVQRKSRKMASPTDTASAAPATGTLTSTAPPEDLKNTTRGITMVLQDGTYLSVNL